MAQDGIELKQWTGFVILEDEDTKEMIHAAVSVVMNEETITYTAMTPDRVHRHTISGTCEENPLFVEMMDLVRKTGAHRA